MPTSVDVTDFSLLTLSLFFFNLPKDGTTSKTEGKQSLCVTEVCPQSYYPTWSLFSKCYLVLIHVHWWPAWSVAWLSCSFWCHGVFFTFSSSSSLLITISLLLWLWSLSCYVGFLYLKHCFWLKVTHVQTKKNPNNNQKTPKQHKACDFFSPWCVKVFCVFPSKAQATIAKCFREETGQWENWMRWSHGRKMRTVNNDL